MAAPDVTSRIADVSMTLALARTESPMRSALAQRGCCCAGIGSDRRCDGGCILEAFHASGGVATGNEVADLLRPRVDQPVSLVARWILSRQVITLAWRGAILLPLFQFDFARMCIRTCMHPVLSELSGAMDDAEVALWFGQPNVWLAGAMPADTIATNVAWVLEAARADRFIAKG